MKNLVKLELRVRKMKKDRTFDMEKKDYRYLNSVDYGNYNSRQNRNMAKRQILNRDECVKPNYLSLLRELNANL